MGSNYFLRDSLRFSHLSMQPQTPLSRLAVAHVAERSRLQRSQGFLRSTKFFALKVRKILLIVKILVSAVGASILSSCGRRNNILHSRPLAPDIRHAFPAPCFMVFVYEAEE